MWAINASMAPATIQRVPLPILSTIIPNRGAKITVENGSIETIQLAASTGTPNLGIRMALANFLNEIILL